MAYRDMLEETDNLRVYLQPDMDADQPYDAGSPPILRIESGYGYLRVEHIDSGDRPHDHDDAIESAVTHWAATPSRDEWRLFEKYLRAYFGTTKIDTYYSGEYWYVAYDTNQWIRSIGFDDKVAPRADYSGKNNYNFLTEIEAWVNGEVYGYVVERKVSGHKVYDDERDDENFEQWEHIDSCFGFYGYEYAKEEALAAFEAEKEQAK